MDSSAQQNQYNCMLPLHANERNELQTRKIRNFPFSRNYAVFHRIHEKAPYYNSYYGIAP